MSVDSWLMQRYADSDNHSTRAPLGMIQDVVTNIVQAGQAFGPVFRNARPVIYHAGPRRDGNARQAIIDGGKVAGFGPTNIPQLIVTIVSTCDC